MRPIRQHLTYSNVMVTILAFVVLTGGTAVALTGSNIVQSDDLGPGAQVRAPDVADNAVGSPDVINNSLTGADIKNKSRVDTCVSGVRIGDLCFRAENFHRPWLNAFNHCANLGLRLPSLGEGLQLVRTNDLPNVDEGEYFWTDHLYTDAADRAFVVRDAGDQAVSSTAAEDETVCVTTPTN
jgi:hypothetical protein